jgi:ParB family transcriptional regulator, chromosome partitioning protein
VHETYNRRPKAIAHADRLAEMVGLDMAALGWRPTVDAYFGRVTKGRILAAVREAKGKVAADRVTHLKKPEMASTAEALLAGTRWVPEPFRTPGQTFVASDEVEATDGEAQSAAAGGEPAMDQSGAEEEDSEASAGIAAE